MLISCKKRNTENRLCINTVYTVIHIKRIRVYSNDYIIIMYKVKPKFFFSFIGETYVYRASNYIYICKFYFRIPVYMCVYKRHKNGSRNFFVTIELIMMSRNVVFFDAERRAEDLRFEISTWSFFAQIFNLGWFRVKIDIKN